MTIGPVLDIVDTGPWLEGKAMETKFDYVIVGGGSAGCVLAARLSEDPGVTVALLEAGGEGRELAIRLPAGVVAMLPGRPFKYQNWAFETVPQPGLLGRCGYQPRGKALGGSSAINAMLYARGHRSDYDDWVAAGAAGWSHAEVLPFFMRSEHNQRGPNGWRGVGGPLHVGRSGQPTADHARICRGLRAARHLAQPRLQRRKAGWGFFVSGHAVPRRGPARPALLGGAGPRTARGWRGCG